MIYPVLVCVAIGYLCGSLPWGLWLGRAFRGVDVRTLGSGNLGATNLFRSLGRGLGLLTLVLDMLKGTVPVVIVPRLDVAAAFPGGTGACAIAVVAAAILGHMFTFLAGFRWGKGGIVGHDARDPPRGDRPRPHVVGQSGRRARPDRGRSREPEVFAWHCPAGRG